MDVTLTRRELAYGVVGVALLLVARQCSRPHPAVETVTAENPLVIESPRLRVAAGADTLTIMGPAAFVYEGLDADDASPPERLMAAVRALQAAVAEAEPGLLAMGVRVLPVTAPPEPLDLPPEAGAAAGPALASGQAGILLADPRGRMLRLQRLASGSALVCAAARTFEREPPPEFAPACR